LNSPVRFELLLFDAEHVAVERWCSALLDSGSHQCTLPAGRRQQLLGHRQRPYGSHDLDVFQANVGRQRALLIRRRLVRNIDLAIGDGNAAGLSVQIQRPLELDPCLVVGTPGLVLLRKRH